MHPLGVVPVRTRVTAMAYLTADLIVIFQLLHDQCVFFVIRRKYLEAESEDSDSDDDSDWDEDG